MNSSLVKSFASRVGTEVAISAITFAVTSSIKAALNLYLEKKAQKQLEHALPES